MKQIDNRKTFVIVQKPDLTGQEAVALTKSLSDNAVLTSTGKAFKEIITKYHNTQRSLHQNFEKETFLDSSVVAKIFRELENRIDRNFFNIPTYETVNRPFNTLNEMADWFAQIVTSNHGSEALLEVILQSSEIPAGKGAVVVVNPSVELSGAISKRFVNTFEVDMSMGAENVAKHVKEQMAIRMPTVDLL